MKLDQLLGTIRICTPSGVYHAWGLHGTAWGIGLGVNFEDCTNQVEHPQKVH